MPIATARPAAILYIDLNGLKSVNDRHGHLAGDAALIHVARLLAGPDPRPPTSSPASAATNSA